MSGRNVAKVVLVATGVIAGLYVLYLIRQVIAAVVIAIFLAIALGPAVDFFQRGKVSRAAAILIVYALMFSAVFMVGLLVVPPIVDEVNGFVDDVPGYVRDIRESKTLREYDDRYGITTQLEGQAEQLPQRLGDAVGTLQNVTVGVFSAIIQLVTILVMAFFLLLDGRRITNFLYAQLGPERQRRARAVGRDVYVAVGGYVAGNFTISAIAGISTYIVLTLADVPFAVPLAVLMAFLDLIPLVGATIGAIIIGIVCAFVDFPTALAIWVVFALVYQQVENNVLQPFVYRRTLALHPLVVIVAVLIGAALLGVLGSLLAIPAAATIQILARDWWANRGEARVADPKEPVPPAPRPEPA